MDGRPLQGTDGPHDVHGTLRDMLVDTEIDDLGSHGHRVDPDSPLEYRSVPVLLAAHSGIDERLTVRVEDMGRPGTSAVRSGALAIDLLSTLNRLPGSEVTSRVVSADDAYGDVKRQLSTGRLVDSAIGSFVKVGPVSWTAEEVPRAIVRHIERPDAELPLELQNRHLDDTAFRSVQNRSLDGDGAVNPDEMVSGGKEGGMSLFFPAQHTTWRTKQPVVDVVGTFDASRIALGSPLSRVPMDVYAPVTARAGDDASRELLGDRELIPNSNVAGLLAQPASMLTTISALSEFSDYKGVTQAERDAPISVIRVRVDGSVGMDAASRERVNLTAQRIRETTGLDVDVTIGSSPTPQNVVVPAGKFGRPELTVQENWVRKGVALVVREAVDRKSVLLFCLVLVVCTMFIANAAGAAVRGRTTELGVLACLGWRPSRLVRHLVGEIAAIGLVAGVLGTAAALGLAPLFDISISWRHAAIAVPAAVAVTVLAALWPAWRGGHVSPMVAVRPGGAGGARAVSPRHLVGMAVANVTRRPGRVLLGVLALAVGICALVLLLVIDLGFSGAVVGTVLGDALALRARSVDYIAAIATVAMGALCVADVLYVNVRERAAELTVLRWSGWRERDLIRLVAYEAVVIGILGVAVGIGCGAWLADSFIGGLPEVFGRIAVIAAAAGLGLTLLAVAIPVATMRRLPMHELVADE